MGDATGNGSELIKQREKSMGPNLSIFYKDRGGLVITSGEGAYLISEEGERYLDCCNNVAGCGHSASTIVDAGCAELKRIQTNGRFLNPVQQRYVQKLLATFPKELDTVYFVNSGSEANDLALRIAQTHSQAASPLDTIILDHAYHGHTAALIGISPYKWYQATDGITYKPSTTHVMDVPDTYRGKYRGFTEESARLYAAQMDEFLERTGGVGTFIAESMIGCGGQIPLPPTYLQLCYNKVRARGGVCIADEVQTGFGRTGSYFWMFQMHGVIPDIVTLGKPMGNGYPMGAVVCRRRLADRFASTGIEYFNTYGGNSVACAIGEAVLDTIAAERLQENALATGQYIVERVRALQERFPCIGDVRGVGLYLGIEIICPRSEEDTIVPNPELTKFLVDFLMEQKVIVSKDGPQVNVIKLKPPLVFSETHADILIAALEEALIASEAQSR